MIGRFAGRRRFKDLSEQEILALAISSEEDDGRIYQSYAEHVRQDYPATAEMLDGMAKEENHHRQRLIDLHKRRFGDVIPLVRREHVAGFSARNPIWLVQNLGIDRIRHEITGMERNAHSGYTRAGQRATDADSRKLLGDGAAVIEVHLVEEVVEHLHLLRGQALIVLLRIKPYRHRHSLNFKLGLVNERV